MKKILIIIGFILILFSSCTMTKKVISEQAYETKINKVNSKLVNIEDYKLIEEKDNVSSELIVTSFL